MPKVSVIIPNYNHAPYLPERIESVLNQTFKDIEVIILDDCSPDHSRDIIEEYARRDERIRLHFNETNSGSTFAQWNKGVELAQGDYVWIAESDDRCTENLIEVLLPYLDSDPEVVLAYGQTQLVDERGQVMHSYLENYKFLYRETWERWTGSFVVDGATEAATHLIFHNTIPNASAAIMRKSAYQEAGGADTDWWLNGDWYFYAKMMRLGKIAFDPAQVNDFRTHTETQRSRTSRKGIVFTEIVGVIDYIVENFDVPRKTEIKARRIVSNWWAGSLTRQEWNAESLKRNSKLFWHFFKNRPTLPLVMLSATLQYVLGNITRWLGIKGQLKRWIVKLFPRAIFMPEKNKTEE